MKAAVIVATYNQPHYLELVLWSLAVQSQRGFEIVVADDGSEEVTRRLVGRLSRELPILLCHVWQEDRGFRKAEALNKAVRATGADYLIFNDGDCIAHPRFVESHLEWARRGVYLVGRTPRMSESLSGRVTVEAVRNRRAQRMSLPMAFDSLFGASRKMEFGVYVRSRWLFRFVQAKKKNLELWGGNFSCHRADFVAVNGFNEEFVGWGKEDLDLGVRFRNLGLKPVSVANRAINLHLWHEAAPDKRANVNWQTALKETFRRSGEYYCPKGYDGH